MAETTVKPTAGKTPTPENKPVKEKAPKEKLQEVFPTAEAAIAAAESRTKGPRRAFKCTNGGKDYFVVANNEGRAGGIAFAQLGGKVEEIGKVKKAKPVGIDAIMAAVGSLPESERKAVLDQLKALGAAK